MKTEILIPLPAFSFRKEGEKVEDWVRRDWRKVIAYGERWLKYYNMKGDVYFISPLGIAAEVNREEIEQLCQDFYTKLCEEDRDDYREFRAEVTRGDEDIDCTNLMLEFMDQIGEFNSIA